jgi:hypothetical protein
MTAISYPVLQNPRETFRNRLGMLYVALTLFSLFLLDTSISFQLFSVELDFSLNTARLFAPLLVGPPKNARAVLKSTLLFSHAAAAKLWSENLISIIVVARIKRQTQR